MGNIDTSALNAAMAAQPMYLRKIAIHVANSLKYVMQTGPTDFETTYSETNVVIRSMPKLDRRDYQASDLRTVCKLAGGILKVRKDRSNNPGMAPPPTQTIEGLRAALFSKAVVAAAKAALRFGGYAGNSFRVDIGEPDYQVRIEKHPIFGPAGYFNPSVADHHAITVPRNWPTQVRKKLGCGSAGNCMILAITPFVETNGRGIYDAIVAVQSRGYSVKVESRVLSTWPGGIVRVFKNLKQALADEPPEIPAPNPLPPDEDEFLADLVA